MFHTGDLAPPCDTGPDNTSAPLKQHAVHRLPSAREDDITLQKSVLHLSSNRWRTSTLKHAYALAFMGTGALLHNAAAPAQPPFSAALRDALTLRHNIHRTRIRADGYDHTPQHSSTPCVKKT